MCSDKNNKKLYPVQFIGFTYSINNHLVLKK